MSVAFRRDGDEEHREPKFEVPIPAGPNLVTARGLTLIGDRIAELECELAAATEEPVRASLLRDLRYWKARQVTAAVAPKAAADRVEFGTRVTIAMNGTRRTLAIVGDDEADPPGGLISFNAALSRAMLGAEVGDVVAFSRAGDAIEILDIAAA